MRRIIGTAPGGGVVIVHPAPQIMPWLSSGGFWRGMPRGFVGVQIERKIARGVSADAAQRLCHALAFGGLTTAEAYAVIRDTGAARYCTGCELWDVADIPTDRTYRNAWRRSQNGGPIVIDERKAMEIDERRAWAEYERQSKS